MPLDYVMRFTIIKDVVVFDNLTGLIWQRHLSSYLFNYPEALEYVKSLPIHQVRECRLPTRQELFSLITDDQTYPALPLNHPFTNIQNKYYWTSSPFHLDDSQVWCVGMCSGTVVGKFKHESLGVIGILCQ